MPSDRQAGSGSVAAVDDGCELAVPGVAARVVVLPDAAALAREAATIVC